MQEILELIPQRPPFVMVDEVVAVDDSSGTTRFKVMPDNLFVQNGVLTEPALIENIAQTAAARIGYICKQKAQAVPVGFIGAVQNLHITALPAVNSILDTRIMIKNQVFDVTLISGQVFVNGVKIAECDMKIFLQPNK